MNGLNYYSFDVESFLIRPNLTQPVHSLALVITIMSTIWTQDSTRNLHDCMCQFDLVPTC